MALDIIGHRGAAAVEPENTLRSIRHAIEAGADWVEIDVQLTRDGRVVLMHDDKVDRTTNGKGLVGSLSFEQIRALDAGKGEKVPLLEEVLELFPEGQGSRLLIELKDASSLEPVLALIRERQMNQWVGLCSFDAKAMLEAKRAMPELYCAYLSSSLKPDPLQMALNIHADAVHLKHSKATADWVRQVRAAGLDVRLWTVNGTKDLEKAMNLGVTGLFTDDPGEARSWLESRK